MLFNFSGAITVIVDVGEPRCIALYKDNLFWTDWNFQTVSRLNLQQPKTSRTVIHKNIDYVMGLLAFTEKKEGAIATDGPLESECLKSNCDGLCLLKQEKVFIF